MSEKKGLVRKRLLVKITLSFIITIIPMVFGFVFMYSHGYRLLFEKIMKNQNAKQEYIISSIEEVMFSTYSQQAEITMNENISFLIDMYDAVSDYQRFVLTQKVLDTITVVKRYNSWIEKMSIHIPSLGKTLTSEENVIPLEQEYYTLNNLGGGFVQFSIVDGKLYIISRMYMYQGSSKYLLVTEISKKEMERFFKYLFSEPSYESYLYLSDGSYMFESGSAQTSDMSPQDIFNAASELKFGEQSDILIQGRKYFARKDKLFLDNFILISTVSEQELNRELSGYKIIFMFMLCISAILISLFIAAFARIYNKPVVKLNEAFSQVRHGILDVNINYRGNDEFSELYASFSFMLEKIRELIYDNYHHTILAQQMELRQLHAQVNPHFLHNSFMNIYAMAQIEDYEGIQEISMKLSRFYQYITRSYQDAVKLEDEYKFVSLYTQILSIRFGDKIEFELEPVPENYKNLQIPKFLLQTFVENAYKYGAGSREQGGRIRISFHADPGFLQIIIEDNGTRLNEETLDGLRTTLLNTSREACPDEFGTGIYNAYRRIKLFYKNGSTISLEQSEMGGMLVRIIIETNAADRNEVL